MSLQESIEIIKSNCDTKEKQRLIYNRCPYSVSKILETLKKPFDREAIAQKTFNAHFGDESSEYYHKSVEDIINMWLAKAEKGMATGKQLDNYIGMILGTTTSQEVLEKYLSSIPDYAANKCRSFDKFYHQNIENKLNFIGRELMLCDFNLGVNGRLDALFTKDNKLLLIDWKNTNDIKTENKYEKMRGPLYNYDACDLNSYTIQLYIYTYLLRNVYHIIDVQIVPLIVKIGEEDFGIYVPQIPYSDKLVLDVIEFAKNEINKSNQ